MMKKIILASFIVLMVAGTSFATGVTVTMTPPKGYTKSNNVTFGYESAGATTMDRYAISTKHANGDKVYGTVSGSGTIYSSSAVAAGTALTTAHNPTIPATSTDSTVTGGAGGWTAM